MLIIGYLLALLIGLSLGLMGGGGSILTVPIFVYVLGYGAKQSIAMTLPVIGLTSLVGAFSHWRSGNVRIGTALIFGGVAMIGSYSGARLAVFVPGEVQLLILSVVILVAAMLMLRPAKPSPANGPPAVRRREPNSLSGKPAEQSDDLAEVAFKLPLAKIVAVAGAVGMLTGIVGIGGGFLVVPALVLLARVPMKQAVGTSLLVIAMNSASGFLGYLGQVEIPWGFVSGFAAIAICGILIGTWLVRFVSAKSLKRGFAVFLLIIGMLMLYENRGVFMGTQPSEQT